MLSRIVLNSSKACLGLRPKLMKQLVRLSSDVTLEPPPIRGMVRGVVAGENTEVFDPKTQSLEEFLNIRFGPEMPTINDDKKPERDVKNFPREPTPVWPERTRLFVIPDSWFQFFYEKTGVTGPYVFGASFLTFLLSKEWYIIEHEFFTGISLAIITAVVCVKFGPQIREYYCTLQDEEVENWDNWQKGMVEYLKNMITTESQSQEMAKQQKILFDAKRENVLLQLEAEFRRRQMVAYNEVRNRLEYMLAKQVAHRQYEQNHMVSWIIENVAKSITPQQEKEALQKCLTDLKQLSAKHKISLT